MSIRTRKHYVIRLGEHGYLDELDLTGQPVPLENASRFATADEAQHRIQAIRREIGALLERYGMNVILERCWEEFLIYMEVVAYHDIRISTPTGPAYERLTPEHVAQILMVPASWTGEVVPGDEAATGDEADYATDRERDRGVGL